MNSLGDDVVLGLDDCERDDRRSCTATNIKKSLERGLETMSVHNNQPVKASDINSRIRTLLKSRTDNIRQHASNKLSSTTILTSKVQLDLTLFTTISISTIF